MADIQIEIRKFVKNTFGSAWKTARGTNIESLAVDQVAPAGAEGARAGLRQLYGNSAAITGIAPVQALPTTAAQWAAYNNDAKKTAYLEAVGMYLTSGTPGVGATLLACLFDLPLIVNSTQQAGVGAGSASKGGLSPILVLKSGITIASPAAPVWFPIAQNGSPNVTAFASAVALENRAVNGRIAIPPAKALGLAVVAPAGTSPLFAPFFETFEFETDNE